MEEFKAWPRNKPYAANYEASCAFAILHTLPVITKMEIAYADQLEKTARSQVLGRKGYYCSPAVQQSSTGS